MPLPKKIPKELASKSSCAGKVYVNRYKVVKRLGSGSFGTVFLVEDLKAGNERKVLKEIFIGELKEDETFDAKREADLLSKLDHPNIVKFLDSFVYMEYFCIVTEFCEGGDLTEKINAWKKSGKTFDESLIIAWLVQLLLAIQFTHKKKILHRDLKTRNIFLKNNMIKIGDFGISRILMGTSDMATTFTGTPYYMSPEILKHEAYNSKSDIWALGVVLYELCTLNRAFEGQNLLGVMYKIVEGETPVLPEKFHPEFRKIFTCMLSKDPIQRPSASELLTNPYISKHVKEIKIKIEQHNTNKCDAVKNSRMRETRGMNKEKSYRSPLKRPMTPLEKMKLRKQEQADEKAERLKQYTAQQYVESRQQFSNVKRKQSRISVGLPWVDEHPDVFTEIPEFEEDDGESPRLAAAHYRAREQNVVTSSGDSGHIASDQEEEHEDEYGDTLTTQVEISDDDEVTLTNVSTIPEDVLEAETYYSQFENEFEDDEDLDDSGGSEGTNEDNDEHNALINQLQAALELDIKDASILEEETIEERFSQNLRQQRITALRQECIKMFGEKTFKKVYRYLKEIRFDTKERMNEESIIAGLKKFVSHPTDCFLVDQLLFLEKQMEISESVR